MKNSIINKDEQGRYHGVRISYHSNDNISWIHNFHHGKYHGYQAWFNQDKTIAYKEYRYKGKIIYEEDHKWTNQIEIKI